MKLCAQTCYDGLRRCCAPSRNPHVLPCTLRFLAGARLASLRLTTVIEQNIVRLFLGALFFVFSVTTSAAITVSGADHHSLTLDAPAQRIVSLAPDLTALAYDAGAGKQMVGADSYSNYPAAAKQLPRIGDAFRVDLERLVALKPDLILAWQGGTPATVIEHLRSLGLNVLVIGFGQLTDVAKNLELIGRITGHDVEAHTAAKQFLDGLDGLHQDYAGRAPVRVFYEISGMPLYTVGGRQIISHMIEFCGGHNIFSDLKELAAPVSLESVLARDPQAIVTGSDEGTDARLKEWQRWPQISAVGTDSLFSISSDLLARATPRILQGGKQLCEDLEKVRKHHKATSG